MNPYWGLSGPILSWVACFETQPVVDFETAYQEAQRLIEAFWAKSGQTEADQAVQYALVALMDEMAMQKIWAGQYDWQQKPLQMVYFQDNCAGEGFFERLAQWMKKAGVTFLPVMPAQAGIQSEYQTFRYILEMYSFCLQVGFRGRYRFLPETAYEILMKELKILLHSPASVDAPKECTQPTIIPSAKHSYLRYQLLGVTGLGGLYLVLTLILHWQSDTLHIPDFPVIQEMKPDV
jgi:type VI protein secretion system component VasF